MEIWKPIINYKDSYEISNKGNVKILKIDEIAAQRISNSYNCVTLTEGYKKTQYYVHRLMAIAFIPNPENKRIVDHINGNKLDNRIENFRWVTHKENAKYHYERLKSKMGPICQYDKNLQLIKEWTNINEILAINNDYNLKILISHLNKVNSAQITYRGYTWKWKDPNIIPKKQPRTPSINGDTYKLKLVEVFKNIGIFENKDFSD